MPALQSSQVVAAASRPYAKPVNVGQLRLVYVLPQLSSSQFAHNGHDFNPQSQQRSRPNLVTPRAVFPSISGAAVTASGVAAFVAKYDSRVRAGRVTINGRIIQVTQPNVGKQRELSLSHAAIATQVPPTVEQQLLNLKDQCHAHSRRRQVTQVSGAVANLILGATIFILPHGFVLSGWIGAPVVVLATLMMLYTANLLGDVLEEIEARGHPVADYGAVGELTFGPKFKPVFQGFCLIECLFMSMLFLVFIGHCMHATFMLPQTLVVFSAASLSILLTLVPQRYVSVLSLFGILMTVFASGALTASGLLLPAKMITDSQSLLGSNGFSGAFTVFAAVALCVGDHAVFPSVYSDVASHDGAVYRAGMSRGFYMFLGLALLVSATAYATFGTALDPMALTNIGKGLQGGALHGFPSWIAVGCNVALAVRSLVVLPHFLAPVISSVMKTWSPRAAHNLELRLPSSAGQTSAIRLLATCLTFYACASGACLLAGRLTELETLTSSLFKSMNAVIIPCWGYFVLCQHRLRGKPLRTFFLLAVLVAGVIWCIFGTAFAVSTLFSA